MNLINFKTFNHFKKKHSFYCEDILSIHGIKSFLSKNNTLDKILLYSSLESTNNTAKAMILSKATHGTVIIADSQTKGRGRYNRSFFSPSGHGIYMSIILQPSRSYPSNQRNLVTLTTAVAICESIEATTRKEPQIKWVNDIYLHQRKVSGILTERVVDNENVPWIVIGIGLNFNTPNDAFPLEIKDIAGSIFPKDTPTITRNQLIAEIINRLLSSYQCSTQRMLSEYKKRMMLIGEETLITGSSNPFKGTILGVDEEGRLVVLKENGQQISLSVGELWHYKAQPKDK